MNMKFRLLAVSLVVVLLSGCATKKPAANHASAPETVMVTYHVKPQNEAQFEQVLADAWKIYRQNNMVLSRPHLIVRDRETGGGLRYVEIFTWASHSQPEHAPAAVKNIWGKMMSLCEARNGHTGLEGGEVEIISQ
jgi:hypothetical protein